MKTKLLKQLRKEALEDFWVEQHITPSGKMLYSIEPCDTDSAWDNRYNFDYVRKECDILRRNRILEKVRKMKYDKRVY